MKDFLLLEKQIGETPLACMQRFQNAFPEYAGIKMTYAGRLDPIAEGLLIALAGDRVHKKNEYLMLPKTYQCTALLGISTDTYDILGISNGVFSNMPMKESDIIDTLGSFVGTFEQSYPPYASKPINGIPMHVHARQQTLDNQTIPSHTVTVHTIKDITIHFIEISEVIKKIQETIQSVSGDFRQEKISDMWNSVGNEYSHEQVTLVSFEITVSGGTYIRSIVHELGQRLGCGACLLSLKRTQIGDLVLENKDF